MSTDQQRYRSILKASSLIGGSAFINILIGMIRTKFVAVLLGPGGVGLMGLYTTLLGPISAVTGMGLSSSGVRQIAEAHGTGNPVRVAEVVKTLRRTVWCTGLLGCLATAALAPWLSQWTFHSAEHAVPVALLGATILLGNIAVGQSCILQGTRRIGDLAKMQVIGAVNGTLISIPCFYLWGIGGVLPSLILSSAAALVTSWWFARQVSLEPVSVSRRESLSEVKRLLSFGLPIMATGLQGTLVAYFLRLVIVKQFGLEGVGIWGAAFTISGILVGFVLNAMGTDYYPRLTAVAHDNQLVSKEVNAQTEIALLLATPALLATILFAPLGIQILYSGKFDAAIPILRWSVYGILGRVISWPLGFIILAQGRGRLFFMMELIANMLHIGYVYQCSKIWGLVGTGIAFVLLYMSYVGLMIVVAHRIARTHWSRANVNLIVGVSCVLMGAGLLNSYVKSPVYYYPLATFILAAVFLVMLRLLSVRTGVSLQSLKACIAR